MSDRIKGSALTMGGAACWGVSGCMGQYLFTREGMDSTWLVPIRLFLAGLILCGFFFIFVCNTEKLNILRNSLVEV